MVKHEADALTLYKRWSLRSGVSVDDVRQFVVERILPAYEELSPDVELGLEAEADGRSVIAVQRWSNVLAHESAFTGASFEKWWAGYQPTLVEWDELVTFVDEWATTSSFSPRGSNQRVVDLAGSATVILGRSPERVRA